MSDQDNLPMVNAGALISQAIDKGISVDSLERLLAMRKELEAEFARKQFFNALATFQETCPEIKKTRAVYNKDQDKTVRYRYAPLDEIIKQVKEPLKACGFSYTIDTEQADITVTAICTLHHTDGHSESSRFTVPVDKGAYMTEPQKVASALTYAKRYAFCDATGIMTSDEDDDANLPGEKPDKKTPPPKPEKRERTDNEREFANLCAQLTEEKAAEYYADLKAETTPEGKTRVLNDLREFVKSIDRTPAQKLEDDPGLDAAFDGEKPVIDPELF